jgi:hypothetical protein
VLVYTYNCQASAGSGFDVNASRSWDMDCRWGLNEHDCLSCVNTNSIQLSSEKSGSSQALTGSGLCLRPTQSRQPSAHTSITRISLSTLVSESARHHFNQRLAMSLTAPNCSGGRARLKQSCIPWYVASDHVESQKPTLRSCSLMHTAEGAKRVAMRL